MSFQTAVKFLYEHPEWFWRDCDDCQKWLFADGEIQRDRGGRPVPNPEPPRCAETPCGSRRRKPRFSEQDWGVFRRWRLCRALRCPPNPGGLSEQDEWEMEQFRVLFEADEREESRRRARDGAALLASIFGA